MKLNSLPSWVSVTLWQNAKELVLNQFSQIQGLTVGEVTMRIHLNRKNGANGNILLAHIYKLLPGKPGQVKKLKQYEIYETTDENLVSENLPISIVMDAEKACKVPSMYPSNGYRLVLVGNDGGVQVYGIGLIEDQLRMHFVAFKIYDTKFTVKKGKLYCEAFEAPEWSNVKNLCKGLMDGEELYIPAWTKPETEELKPEPGTLIVNWYNPLMGQGMATANENGEIKTCMLAVSQLEEKRNFELRSVNTGQVLNFFKLDNPPRDSKTTFKYVAIGVRELRVQSV